MVGPMSLERGANAHRMRRVCRSLPGQSQLAILTGLLALLDNRALGFTNLIEFSYSGACTERRSKAARRAAEQCSHCPFHRPA